MHGVMSYGPPMMRKQVIHLVDTGLPPAKAWHSMLELNRMAFDNKLPKNSESRCIAISIRLIRKNAPHIKWLLSYSDATASGDGTIYRAVGFLLTRIGKNTSIIELPDGRRITNVSLDKDIKLRAAVYKQFNVPLETGAKLNNLLKVAKLATGYQLRYIKLLDPTCKLNVPILPYSEIDKIGAGMLRGKKITRAARMGGDHV